MKISIVGKDSGKRGSSSFQHLANGNVESNTSILEQNFMICVKNLKNVKTFDIDFDF